MNDLYSAVGVLGFMWPFFNEIQLNGELLPEQLPFCYAHELSHQLGVSFLHKEELLRLYNSLNISEMRLKK